MDSININMARADFSLNQILSGIPVGAAYFLLKSKTQELETMYYQQVKRQLAEAEAAQQSSQPEPQEAQVLDQGEDEAVTA